MCSNNVKEKCGQGICTCTIKKEPKVEQTWISSTGVRHKIIAVSIREIVTEGGSKRDVFWIWDKCTLASHKNPCIILVKEYKELRSMTKTYWLKQGASGGLLIASDSYESPYYEIIGKKEVTITEGEGLDGSPQ